MLSVLVVGSLTGLPSLRVPAFFSDEAVLQVWDEGDARSFVFGAAAANASVSLTIASAAHSLPFSRTYYSQASTSGRFSFQLDGTYATDPQGRHGPHYGPYAITISSRDEVVHIRNISFGDVYLCVGDELMAAPAQPQQYNGADQIHRFLVREARAEQPADDVRGEWATGSTGLGAFSPLCYGTAVALARLDPAGRDAGNTTGGAAMPIAIMLAAVNGSLLVEWAPAAASGACGSDPHTSATLYNGMVAPLAALAIR
eukprot:3358840-Prymnesium_polylepis.1